MPGLNRRFMALALLLWAAHAPAQPEEKPEAAQAPSEQADTVDLGEMAPDFSWPEITYENGKPAIITRTLYEFRDRQNILICFAPQLGASFTPAWIRKFLSLPEQENLKKVYTKVVLVFPNRQDEVNAYRERNEMYIYMLGDPDRRLSQQYGVPAEVLTDHWRNRRRRALALVGSDTKVKYINYFADEGEGLTDLNNVLDQVGREHVARLKAEGKWTEDEALAGAEAK